MEYIIFGAKIVILLLLCFILLRSLQYFILQVGFYYKSRHLAAFLDKKKVTAEEYLFRNEKLWRRNFRNAPYLVAAVPERSSVSCCTRPGQR